MTIARSRLVDVEVSRWYHCISRCVRKARLLEEGAKVDRMQWLQDRIQLLADLFAISVGGFAVLGNHLHVLVRLDPHLAHDWSDEDVVRRWAKLFPPRDRHRNPLPVNEQWLQQKLRNSGWVQTARKRLSSLSWFMKCLKEPLSRMANKEDGMRGAFFEGRFKSIAILDEESLLAVCAYIDLNPLAAGIAKTPEQSPHTSIKDRVEHACRQGRLPDLKAAMAGSVAGSKRSAKLEDGLWLIPIEDRRRLGETREGMLESFSLGSYLLLVEHTGRLLRHGKAAISPDLADVFERLGASADGWAKRMDKLAGGRLLGRYLAASRQKLRDAAQKVNAKKLANLNSCPAG